MDELKKWTMQYFVRASWGDFDGLSYLSKGELAQLLGLVLVALMEKTEEQNMTPETFEQMALRVAPEYEDDYGRIVLKIGFAIRIRNELGMSDQKQKI